MLRQHYRDEHLVARYQLNGTLYSHIEHARWGVVWDELGLDSEYKPQVSILISRSQLIDKRTFTIRGTERYRFQERESSLYYSPHFRVTGDGIDLFVDVKQRDPCPDSIVSAVSLFRQTSVPLAMFGEAFVPNWRTLAPAAVYCRESRSPLPYYLLCDDRRISIGPLRSNEPAIVHPKLQQAFAKAMLLR